MVVQAFELAVDYTPSFTIHKFVMLQFPA